MEFKDKLAKLRRMKGLSQEQLAESIGTTKRSIQNYERGARMPKGDTIAKLAAALDAEEEALVSGEQYFVIEAKDKYGSRGKITAEKVLHSVNALFAGGDISEEDKDAVMQAIQNCYWKAKEDNKKYTPKKYRKDEE